MSQNPDEPLDMTGANSVMTKQNTKLADLLEREKQRRGKKEAKRASRKAARGGSGDPGDAGDFGESGLVNHEGVGGA